MIGVDTFGPVVIVANHILSDTEINNLEGLPEIKDANRTVAAEDTGRTRKAFHRDVLRQATKFAALQKIYARREILH